MVTQPTSSDSSSGVQQWALLSYRVPREPSTPRIAIWRKLKSHGVAQVGDGLVALPFDARTKEHLEWIAAMVIEADGEAIVWVATTTKTQDRSLAERMNADRDEEYQSLIDDIGAAAQTGAAGPTATAVDGRTIARLRREWRRIERRDYFRSPLREPARQALHELAGAVGTPVGDSA